MTLSVIFWPLVSALYCPAVSFRVIFAALGILSVLLTVVPFLALAVCGVPPPLSTWLIEIVQLQK